MGRTVDLDGHPWSEAGQQGFRLVDAIDDLTETDVLRLTDRVTGTLSYWRATEVEKTAKGWRGLLSQVDPPDGEPS